MKKIVAPLLVLNLCICSSETFATTYTFTGNGNWTNASNWAGGIVPPAISTSSDTIVISGTCTYSSSTEYVNEGHFRIASGGVFTIEPPHVFNGLAAFETRNKLVVEGTFHNKTDMTIWGVMDISGTVTNDGKFNIQPSAVTVKSGGTFNNTGSVYGKITVQNGGILNNSGTILP